MSNWPDGYIIEKFSRFVGSAGPAPNSPGFDQERARMAYEAYCKATSEGHEESGHESQEDRALDDKLITNIESPPLYNKN